MDFDTPSPGSPRKSLWSELADGTAGPVVRAVITLALAAFFTGGALIGSYLLAALVPAWDRRTRWGNSPWASPSAVHPTEELVGCLAVLAGAGFLIAVAWVWSRKSSQRSRAVWYGAVLTVVVGLVTTAVAVLADQSLDGETELVISGVIFAGFAAMLLMWVQVWRWFSRARPAHNDEDGRLDVRCPTCGYRMVGLHESRCPECGTVYTLDELLTRQTFEKLVPVGKGNRSDLRPPAVPSSLPPPPLPPSHDPRATPDRLTAAAQP